MKKAFSIITSILFVAALISVFFTPDFAAGVGGLMLMIGLIMRVWTRGVNEYNRCLQKRWNSDFKSYICFSCPSLSFAYLFEKKKQ